MPSRFFDPNGDRLEVVRCSTGRRDSRRCGRVLGRASPPRVPRRSYALLLRRGRHLGLVEDTPRLNQRRNRSRRSTDRWRGAEAPVRTVSCPSSFGLEAGARECVAQQRAAAVSRRAPGSSPKLQAGLGTGHCPVGGRTPVHKTGASFGGEVHGRWHGGVSGPKTPHERWSWRNQASRPTAPIREVAMADAPLQRHRRSGRASIKIPGTARERLAGEEGLDRCRVPLQSLRSRGKHGAIATKHARCLV